MQTQSHLTMNGLTEIIGIAETMNHCKSRTAIMQVLNAAPKITDLFATEP